MFRLLLFLTAVTTVSPLAAYVGPGAGISVLGSLLGILATIVVAIGAIILWPVRKMMKRRKAKAANAPDDSTEAITGKPGSPES